ncbi:autotransporter domain-containing protein [Terasakiella pusilla]|uniref:autotransporter domain-containing protein n=1 Tax=Terasakiella pusilla TaxID=64973 RepID=UPI003AA8CA18
MKKFNANTTLRNALLSGMSVVAFTAMVGGQALAADLTTAGSETWSGAATFDQSNVQNALKGDNVAIGAGHTLTVTNDGTANDNSANTNTFLLGAVTNAAGTGNLAITVGSANDLSVTLGSVSAVNFTATGTNATDGNITIANSGALTLTGNLVLDNSAAATTADTIVMTQTGDVTVAGTTTITGGALAAGGATTALTLNGASNTFTGLVTVQGGAGHLDNDATLTLNGASTTFTGGVSLNDDAAVGDAHMVVSGSVNQTITGAINGGGAATAEGTLTVNNGVTDAAGYTATFTGAIGATAADNDLLLVQVGASDNTTGANAVFQGNVDSATINIDAGNHANEDSSASFAGDVTTATAFSLDDGAAGTATATFNGTGAQSITGAITVGTDGEGVIAVTNTGGTVDFNNDIGATGGAALGSMTIASGATVNLDGDTFVNSITGGGTVNFGTTGKKIELDSTFGASGTAMNVSVDKSVAATIDATADTTAFTNIALDAAGSTLTLGGTSEVNVTGNVTATTDGEGVLTIAGQNGVTTITGNIGTSSSDIDTLNAGAQGLKVTGDTYAETITGAAGNMNFDGNVTSVTALNVNAGGANFAKNVTASTAFTFAADGTMTFDGTTDQTITGAITTAGASTGNIAVTNTGGTVTFKNALGDGATTELGDLTLSDGTTTVFEGAVGVGQLSLGTGTATFDGAVVVDGAGASSGDLSFTGATSTITVGDSIASGSTLINATTGNVVDTTGKTVTVNMNTKIGDGGTLVLIDSNNDADTSKGTYSVTNTGLFTYSVATTNNDITITATKRSTGAIASTLGVTSSTASALDSANTAVATGDAAALTALNSALNAGGATATKAAETLALQADTLGGTSSIAISNGGAVLGVTSNRLASMRSGTQHASAGQTGFATGDTGMAKAVWLKSFGNWSEQDTKKGVAGFDADTYGLAGGFDAEVADKVRLGASLAYSNTDVEGKGAGNSQTDINSYQMTVYGDYTADSFYVEGMAGYARNNHEGQRTISVGGLTRQANADYDSNQYMASVGAGMPIQISGDTFFTPTAGFAYTHVSTDSYTETGAGNWNLNVNSKDINSSVASLGAKMHTKFQAGNGSLIPEVRAGISYDFSGDEAVATSSYTGGGATFTTTGAEVEQFGGNVGLGLTYDDGAWAVGANYEADLKSDFVGHSATLEARFKF